MKDVYSFWFICINQLHEKVPTYYADYLFHGIYDIVFCKYYCRIEKKKSILPGERH